MEIIAWSILVGIACLTFAALFVAIGQRRRTFWEAYNERNIWRDTRGSAAPVFAYGCATLVIFAFFGLIAFAGLALRVAVIGFVLKLFGFI